MAFVCAKLLVVNYTILFFCLPQARKEKSHVSDGSSLSSCYQWLYAKTRPHLLVCFLISAKTIGVGSACRC